MDKDNLFQPEQTLDADLQKELDEALGSMSLDELIEAEEKQAKSAGQKGTGQGVRKGRVLAIHGDDIFVDIGGRSDGLLPADQFTDEPLPEVGDEVEVTVEGFDASNGLVKLSREGAVLAATWDSIAVGQIVEGVVKGHNKGGLELRINGIDAFMPISQIDTVRVEELQPYMNDRLQCIIQEIDFNKETIIVSRRELLKQQAAESAEKIWDTLHEGKIVSGKVRSIMPYGAFVDIGGVDGLLHIKDMAHSRIEKAEEIVHVGQELELRVLSADKDAKRIGLGLKQTLADPWEAAETKWVPGNTVNARVVKLMDFGAFVELEPGVEGLVPISEMSFRRINHPKEVVKVGDMIKVAVMTVDVGEKADQPVAEKGRRRPVARRSCALDGGQRGRRHGNANHGLRRVCGTGPRAGRPGAYQRTFGQAGFDRPQRRIRRPGCAGENPGSRRRPPADFAFDQTGDRTGSRAGRKADERG